MDNRDLVKSDEQIAYLVQSGEIEYFGILVERYEAKIKRYGQKFLSSFDDISDAVQDIFIKAYKNIQSFDIKRKFSTWLYRIAHNEFVNMLKKNKRSPLLSFDFDVFLPFLVSKEDINGEIEKKEMKNLVDKCLDKLEEKYREPIALYYFEGMSYKEISNVMKIPVSTVGVRVRRAKEKMKTIYQKMQNHEA